MDERIELLNKIAKDIVKNNSKDNIINEVKLYIKLLDSTIRNFYEIRGENSLFKYVYYMEGKDNFMMDEEEFQEELSEINDKVFEDYGIKLWV